MTLKWRVRAATFCIAAFLTSQSAAANTDEIAVRKALEIWTETFNSRDTQTICDLFAPSLRYDFRGLPERV